MRSTKWVENRPRGFCSPPDHTPLLAALGVMGVESHYATRAAIRQTWLRTGEADGIVSRFVLRGVGANDTTFVEAAANGDIIFVDAQAKLPRSSGPLLSLVLWIDCALIAWPRAQFIAKGEEDTWLHLPGLASRLRLDMAALQARRPNGSAALRLFWGVQESFHWELAAQRPLGFAYKFGKPEQPCMITEHATAREQKVVRTLLPELPTPPFRVSNLTTVGPYAYAKGPAVFVTRSAIEEAVRPSGWARRNLQQIVHNERTLVHDGSKGDVPYVRCHSHPSALSHSYPSLLQHSSHIPQTSAAITYPPTHINLPRCRQDDVWLGLAMATSVTGDGLAAVHLGAVGFAEGIPGLSRGACACENRFESVPRLSRAP